MKYLTPIVLSLLMAGTTLAVAQDNTKPADKPFEAGLPLGIVVDGKHEAMSDNVKVYGAIVSAESCIYDAERDLILAINRGASQMEAPNDGFVSLINHDGSVHTTKWIGANRNGLVLNQPFGSHIENGKLYLADSDGGTADGAQQISVVRMFDMKTGAPAGEIKVPDSPWFNDLTVAKDGTIYATQTAAGDRTADTFRVYKVTPDGQSSVLIQGEPLNLPNGIAIDNDGNLVVVNIGNKDIMTFSTDGKLLKTVQSAQGGNDGIEIMEDGTMYISSVREGGIAKVTPDGKSELIATGIPSAASMCYDAGANQLVIPMNPNNSMAFVPLSK